VAVVPAPAPAAAAAARGNKTLIQGVLNPMPAAAAAPKVEIPTAAPTTPGVAPFAPTPVTGLPLQAQKPGATTVTSAGTAPPQQAAGAGATAAAAAAHQNGQMAGKLEQIGLTPAQIDAVLALSRDVVERVVWEVVPVLAETLIKEEIARLTK